jgi:hypothetical protein
MSRGRTGQGTCPDRLAAGLEAAPAVTVKLAHLALRITQAGDRDTTRAAAQAG